jgi:hypothetical protein
VTAGAGEGGGGSCGSNMGSSHGGGGGGSSSGDASSPGLSTAGNPPQEACYTQQVFNLAGTHKYLLSIVPAHVIQHVCAASAAGFPHDGLAAVCQLWVVSTVRQALADDAALKQLLLAACIAPHLVSRAVDVGSGVPLVVAGKFAELLVAQGENNILEALAAGLLPLGCVLDMLKLVEGEGAVVAEAAMAAVLQAAVGLPGLQVLLQHPQLLAALAIVAGGNPDLLQVANGLQQWTALCMAVPGLLNPALGPYLVCNVVPVLAALVANEQLLSDAKPGVLRYLAGEVVPLFPSTQSHPGVLATVGLLLLQQPSLMERHGAQAVQGLVGLLMAPAAVLEVWQLQCSLVKAAVVAAGASEAVHSLHEVYMLPAVREGRLYLELRSFAQRAVGASAITRAGCCGREQRWQPVTVSSTVRLVHCSSAGGVRQWLLEDDEQQDVWVRRQ